MKRKMAATVLILIALAMLPLQAYAESNEAVKNARNGVVYIQFEFSDAYEGNGIQSGTGFFIGEKNKNVRYI